jgi:ABC-type multidrug transport system ATPase subunit
MGPQGQGAACDEPVRAFPLIVDGVHHRWGAAPVLRGAKLAVPPATVAWLGGPNGAGKTTLLRIAGGLLTPAQGRVRILGLDPERERRACHRRLGYLSAGDRGLYARVSVIDHLELWASLAFVPRHRRRELIEGTVARFELGELRGRRVDRLSMGQRQRVRLAMTFLHEPDLVLLDEPHTSLDEFGLALLEDAMAGVTSRGGAVLWCSPDATALALPADERHLLSGGEVVSA